MTQVKRVNELNLCYCPHNLTEEAKYRYDCIIKYKKLRAKGFDEKEALNFLGVCRSTFFHWLSKFNKKCGNLQMKTTELENKSRRPHNIMQVAQAEADKIERRLNRIFLMKAAIQRQAERVTAEEIRTMAQDLEEALGNYYSIMCKEFQEPYVRRNEYVPYNCEDMETQLHKARFYVRKGTALHYCNPEIEEIVKVKLEVIE